MYPYPLSRSKVRNISIKATSATEARTKLIWVTKHNARKKRIKLYSPLEALFVVPCISVQYDVAQMKRARKKAI